MERTALSTSMGTIVFEPPESVAVGELVQAQADRVLAMSGTASRPDILVGIRTLDVTTPGTALYWDMVVDIELLLRVDDQERSAKGTAVGRTWLWPSQERLQSVTSAAFADLSRNLDVALRELLVGGN
jgi:hypothetical protein